MKQITSREMKVKISEFEDSIKNVLTTFEDKIDGMYNELSRMKSGLEEMSYLESQEMVDPHTGEVLSLFEEDNYRLVRYTEDQLRHGVSLNVRIPIELMKKFDEYMRKGDYKKRSPAIVSILSSFFKN